MRCRSITIAIDLDAIRASAECIRRRTQRRLIAVIKADAYGCGAARVADALADIADDFAYFSIHEAREVGRPGLVLGPLEADAAQYFELGLRPSVHCWQDAERLACANMVVNIETGMQRYGCTPEEVERILERYSPCEACTHAGSLDAVRQFQTICVDRFSLRHAAATALLDEPTAWLDAVRPGYWLYRRAMRVSTPLLLVRETRGPVGYGGFECPRVGVILGGYSNRLAPAPVVINGRRQRLIEAGMNTSFVSVDPADRAGDEVVLLGDGLDEVELAAHFGVRPHTVLCRYGGMGPRVYVRNSAISVAPIMPASSAGTGAA